MITESCTIAPVVSFFNVAKYHDMITELDTIAPLVSFFNVAREHVMITESDTIAPVVSFFNVARENDMITEKKVFVLWFGAFRLSLVLSIMNMKYSFALCRVRFGSASVTGCAESGSV